MKEQSAQRVDKIIAKGGVYSRKEAKELVRQGRVLVNGGPALSGEQKIALSDTVTLDGVVLRNQAHIYIMMNKPAGVVCATRDDRDPTVLDLLPQELRGKGLFPAGRLDKDTLGFVLITDDGEFAHRMLSPAHHVPKTYHARLDKPFQLEQLREAFAAGLVLDGGDRCSPARLRLLEHGPQPLAELIIHEGMYHQVKRMFSRFSLDVLELRRVQIGGLPLDEALLPGQSREILHKELARIL